MLDEHDFLCKEVASKYDTAILAFSRGKDSVATFLKMRKWFKRIIPYHMAMVPHLSFVDRALIYYENVFDVEIIRLLHGEAIEAIIDLEFQSYYDIRRIEALNIPRQNNDSTKQVPNLIREEYDIPWAWLATGQRIVDSGLLARRMNKCKGIHTPSKTFYPIYKLSTKETLDLIENERVSLSEDYLITYHGVDEMFTCDELEVIKRMYPEDYEKILQMYPLIDSQLARNEFRKAHFNAKMV